MTELENRHVIDKRWLTVIVVLLALLGITAKISWATARSDSRQVIVTFVYGQQPQAFLDCYVRRGDVRRNITNGKLEDGDTCQETLYK